MVIFAKILCEYNAESLNRYYWISVVAKRANVSKVGNIIQICTVLKCNDKTTWKYIDAHLAIY